jgi:hypothetical protein
MSVPGNHAPRSRVLDSETEHTIKNHLAVIVGFCQLLLGEMAEDDPRHADVQEINRAARELMAIFRRDMHH